MVRAGRHGEGENEALTAGIVGIGWADLGDLSNARTTEDIRARLNATRPTAKPLALASWAGQIEAFLFRIQVGDIVALPLKSTPAVAFGRVTGGYHYAADASMPSEISAR